MNYSNLMLLPQWVTDSFKIFQAAFIIIIAIAAVILIIAVLSSPPQTGVGSNAITGASESYYTKNKGKNNEGRIRNLIILCASTIAVCAILYFIAFVIFPGS